MKLKKLEIFDPSYKLLRELVIEDQFYLIGEVEEKKDKRTSNALGKTVFLQMISYCLCGNMIKDLNALRNYILKLSIEDKEEIIIIERIIGNSKIKINNEIYQLDVAKQKMDINRDKIHHLVHLDARTNVILEKPNKYGLYQAAYSILGLTEIIESTAKYYERSEKIETYTKRKKYLESNLENSDEKSLIEDQLKELDSKLNKLSNLNEIEIKKQNEDLYSKQQTLKRKKNILLTNKYEANDRIKIITNYIQNLKETPQNIISFIKQADEELGGILSLRIEEAIQYHKKLSVERVEILIEEKNRIQYDINEYNKQIEILEKQIPNVSNVIKESNEIKKLFEIQNMLFEKKQELLLANQSLTEITQLTKKIDNLKLEKLAIHKALTDSNLDSIKKKFSDYSRKLVKRLYPDSYKSDFDISVIPSNKINKTKIPIVFDFRINKDNSEGVRNSRNLIVDLLMLKYSDTIQFMAWDSTTFNGIDPNQLSMIFNEIHTISKETKKQIIVCFNSFQLGEHYSTLFSDELIPSRCKVKFNNNSTLLDTEF